MILPSSSIRIGTTNPNAAMLSAIWRICFFECVRALRALGLSALMGKLGMRLSCDAEAKRARASTCVGFRSKVLRELRLESYPQIAMQICGTLPRTSNVSRLCDLRSRHCRDTSPAGNARRPGGMLHDRALLDAAGCLILKIANDAGAIKGKGW